MVTCQTTLRHSHDLKELVADCAGTLVHLDLHRRDLRINLLHELHHEVHQFVLAHRLQIEVGDQEADVVPLRRPDEQGSMAILQPGLH